MNLTTQVMRRHAHKGCPRQDGPLFPSDSPGLGHDSEELQGGDPAPFLVFEMPAPGKFCLVSLLGPLTAAWHPEGPVLGWGQAEGPWGKKHLSRLRPLPKLHGDNGIHAPSALEGRWVGRDPAATWREVGPILELCSQRLSTSKAISFMAGAAGWNPDEHVHAGNRWAQLMRHAALCAPGVNKDNPISKHSFPGGPRAPAPRSPSVHRRTGVPVQRTRDLSFLTPQRLRATWNHIPG